MTTETPALSILSPTIPFGHAVHASAYSLLADPTDAFDLNFHWDFGVNCDYIVADPRSYAIKWTQNIGRNFRGPVAAHRYLSAGTKSGSLSIYKRDADGGDGALVQTVKFNFSVTSPTRQAFYCNGLTGSDSNPGTMAAPVKTLDELSKRCGNATELYLAAGQTFPFEDEINAGFSDLQIGAYGTGTAPTIRKMGGGNLFEFWNAQNVTISGITFDSDPANLEVLGIARGINVSLVGCNFANLQQAWQGSAALNGSLVMSCTQLAPYGINQRCEWIEGSNHVSAGNTYYNSAGESPYRMDSGSSGSTGGNLVACVFNRAGQTLTPARTMAKAALTFRYGSQIHVEGNLFVDSECSLNIDTAGQLVQTADVRGNLHVGSSQGGFDAVLRCNGNGVIGAVLQNNTLYMQQGPCIVVAPVAPGLVASKNVTIRGNIGYGWSPNSRLYNVAPTAAPWACDAGVFYSSANAPALPQLTP